jgi:hypothetical protein
MLRTLWKATALATAAVMFWATAALADNVNNDVTAGGNDTITAGGSTTINYKIVGNSSPSGDPSGCNVSVSAPATASFNVPGAVTASAASLTFTGCNDPQSITYSSSTVGDHVIALSGVSGGVAGSKWNDNATFTLHVNAATPSDTTAPVITPSVSGTLGNNGWYTSDVTVSWTVVDNESAISSSSGCGSTTINTDTAGTTLTCTATSAGGTASASVTIKRDATNPSVSCDAPAPSFLLNQSPANVTAAVSDAVSGPLASSASGAADTSSVGNKSITLNGEDNAGNTNSASCSYSVGYQFVGFTSPVDNPQVLNKAKAGQAIPFKWRLLDANNDPVGDLSSVSATVATLNCSLATTADSLEEYATGSSGLQNLGNGYYQWNWKSPTSYANSCKTFKLDLGEASPRTALFQFTR